MAVQIIVGHALTKLRELPDESVHCAVTSPPYWGLRRYGGDSDMIGLEPSLEKHIENLVLVFREVRRVLRKDGTLWMNYGDAYSHSGSGGGSNGIRGTGMRSRGTLKRQGPTPGDFKPKDLMGLGWRVAFALQEDGWFFRRDIVWHKPNPAPEGVTDRPRASHEFIFLMSRERRYFYDSEAVKVPVTGTANARQAIHNSTEARKARASANHKYAASGELRGMRPPRAVPTSWATGPGAHGPIHPQGRTRKDQTGRSARCGRQPGWRKSDEAVAGVKMNGSLAGAIVDLVSTRHLRDVWTIAPAPFRGAHFATFPPKLIEPCIMAGCPPGGVVLDPFAGAGTTGLVAERLGRDAILIEINADYADMARQRIAGGA